MNYSELQSAVADWLNRSDLAAVIPQFIRNAEARLRRDTRIQRQTVQAPFTITEDAQDVPADFRAIDSWYYDGPVHRGPIRVVAPEVLPGLKFGGVAGTPRQVAVADRKFYFAPEPSEPHDSVLIYYRRIPDLTDAAPENWLLDDHSDIYLYAALAESAPYLKDDERLMVWEGTLNARLEDLARAQDQERWNGNLRRRPERHRVIGG